MMFPFVYGTDISKSKETQLQLIEDAGKHWKYPGVATMLCIGLFQVFQVHKLAEDAPEA